MNNLCMTKWSFIVKLKINAKPLNNQKTKLKVHG